MVDAEGFSEPEQQPERQQGLARFAADCGRCMRDAVLILHAIKTGDRDLLEVATGITAQQRQQRVPRRPTHRDVEDLRWLDHMDNSRVIISVVDPAKDWHIRA